MKIAEFRKQYPEYGDVSDEDLAKALHQKHYADVEYSDFAERFGVGGGFDLAEMADNIPISAFRLVRDLLAPAMTPIDSITAAGKTGIGIGEKILGIDGEYGAYPDAIIDHFVDRYGSKEAALQSLEKDPVGVLSDAAGVLSAGGLAIPKVGAKISRAGRAIDPINVAKNAVAYGAGKIIPDNFASNQYQSAVKFNTTTPRDKREAMARTALDEQIMPNTGGLDRAQSLIGELNNKIEGLISEASSAGKSVPVSSLFSRLKELRQSFGAATRPEAARDIKQIEQVARKVGRNLSKHNKDSFSPEELQSFKQQMYKEIAYDKKVNQSRAATNEGRKAMARAAKEELELMAPEVRDLNAREGRLIELSDALEQKVSRIENNNNIPLMAGIAPAAGHTIAGGPGAILSTMAAVADMPGVKARNALMLNRVQRRGMGQFLNNSLPWQLGRDAMIQGGRIEREQF